MLGSRVKHFVYLALIMVAFRSSGEETVDRPLPPREAAATMKVPLGFSVSLFAGEPDVVQPIDFSIDSKGRLWVCEARSYPKHTDEPAGDRIIILEDSDNDGKHDQRTVFYDRLNYVTGIEVGFGGTWVMSPPHLFFIPDRDGDDIPDGEPEVVLDGFGNHANSHNLANGFEWGPDGWLYGTHGRTNWSLIGLPGAPDEERVRFDGGVWRINPVTREWESFCDGTTNPWGIDWDEHGEAFMTNCVNPHLYHAIQGAHYEPWRGRASSQHAYRRIETIADHLHYAGSDLRELLGTEETLVLGGGHAHCGVLVYPRGGPWPERYHGAIFLNNIHGDRINCDIPFLSGSGFTASHAPDLMISEDPWFMGVTLHLGPDGSVFVSDWSDTGECHSTRNTRKETGRIYKISFQEPEMPELDLENRTSIELARLALSPNRFVERHARRILHERSVGGEEAPVHAFFRTELRKDKSAADQLKALWGLHVTGGLDDEFLAGLSGAEPVEAWAIRLACEDGEAEGGMWDRILDLSGKKAPQRLQRYLISAAMRLPIHQRWPVVEMLTARNDYPDDRNIPLLLWYLTETLFDDDPDRFAALVKSPHSIIGEHVARRVASEPGHMGVPRLLEIARDHPARLKGILAGIVAGLEGIRNLDMPPGWPEVFAGAMENSDEDVRKMAIELALVFDDPEAMKRLRFYAADPRIGEDLRNHSLRALISKQAEGLDSLLLELIEDESVRRIAILGLADYNHPDTPGRILASYAKLTGGERQDALGTLSSRSEWAARLLDGVEAGLIPSRDVTAFTARQMVNLGNRDLTERVKQLWGEMRRTTKEKEKKMASLKKSLRPDLVAEADPEAGRLHFQNLCSACHKLFGEGGEVGPELTGSQRNNLDYLLENLVDPSASVSKDFQMQVIEMTNGRMVSGFAESESESVLVIRSINERVVIPRGEIAKRTVSEDSIMPEGLLEALSTRQKRDLIAYLSSPHQVPLKPAKR